MISRVKCLVTGTVLFFGALSAFANSTAFNGFVQSGGNTGIDFSSIDGGSYRITVTRAGQLNFRFMIGGQAFDSNPEASVMDGVVSSDAYWTTKSAPPGYTESRAVREAPVLGALPFSYSYGLFTMHVAKAQEQAQVPSSNSDDPEGVHIGAGATSFGSVTSSDGVSGSNFYLPPQSPETFKVPASSLIVFSGSNNADFVYNNDQFITDQVPEPATFGLIVGGLLLAALLHRRFGNAS